MKLLPIIYFVFILIIACKSDSLKDENREIINSLLLASSLQTENSGSFSCKLNSTKWEGKGNFDSHFYFSKGMSGMFDENPFAIFSFKSNTAPDDRQLTISIIGFNEKKTEYNSSALEIRLEGTSSGDLAYSQILGNRRQNQWSDAKLHFSKLNRISNEEIIASGEVSAVLRSHKSFGKLSNELALTQGVFTDVRIKVYNEKY
ncbi:MAG: hypothetical protein HOP11_01730 [Saprospiraceae bacterium]|nr:hypothetical protein [Saprospiraceae bacterium]